MKLAYLIEPPFNFRDNAGKVIGCDIEVAEHVLQELGHGPVELIEAAFAELLPGVATGRWRMTTGLFGTEERRKIASFSRPVWALPDGLLVKKGNPLQIAGYRSIAGNPDCIVAIVRDQFQHRTAVEFAVPGNRIAIFDTYAEAAVAVRDGCADAYASVARAHSGFMAQNPSWALEVVAIPLSEKAPAFGSFAFGPSDIELIDAVDEVLARYLGSPAHRETMSGYGFSGYEIDLLLA